MQKNPVIIVEDGTFDFLITKGLTLSEANKLHQLVNVSFIEKCFNFALYLYKETVMKSPQASEGAVRDRIDRVLSKALSAPSNFEFMTSKIAEGGFNPPSLSNADYMSQVLRGARYLLRHGILKKVFLSELG